MKFFNQNFSFHWVQKYTVDGSGSQILACVIFGKSTRALYSEPKATYWSVSAITAGLHAIGSRRTPKPLLVPTTNVKKPSRSSNPFSRASPNFAQSHIWNDK